MIKEELIEEMFSDWLWDKYYDELYNKAVTQVEKEEGFWKSVFGVKQKIKDRHWKLFKELKEELTSSEPHTNNHTQKNSSGACTSLANEDSVLKARSSENSQHPRIKPDRGGELKPIVAGDETDNGSPADTEPLTEVKGE